MLIIQPDRELMKHNYYHYAYHTGTENYSWRIGVCVWGGSGLACAYVKYILSCAHSMKQRRKGEGDGRGGEGGWRVEEWSHHHARRPRNKSHLF